jgi:hypothetical protein
VRNGLPHPESPVSVDRALGEEEFAGRFPGGLGTPAARRLLTWRTVNQKRRPRERGLPVHTSAFAKGDRQAAAASNCQFLGRMTASMACTMPFVATISALVTRAPLTRTSDEDTTAVS